MIEEFFIQFALIYPLVRVCLLFFNETISQPVVLGVANGGE